MVEDFRCEEGIKLNKKIDKMFFKMCQFFVSGCIVLLSSLYYCCIHSFLIRYFSFRLCSIKFFNQYVSRSN